MCGLLGMAGPGIVTKDLEFFHELAVISQLRGIDGAGFYQINTRAENGRYSREKLEKTGDDYNSFKFNLEMRKVGNKFGDYVLDDIVCTLVMGHVRAATRGVICDENSHPFMFENLVGAHNGTLRDKQYQDKDKTDSELMFKDMNERGVQAVLEDLNPASAYAISVYNRKDKTISFARNKDRPLYIAVNKERDVIYWASEKNMLLFCSMRKGMKLDIDALEEDHIITTSPMDVKSGKKDIWDKVKIIPNTKVFHPPVNHEEHWRELWGDWESAQRSEEKKEEKKAAVEIIPPNKNKKTKEDKKMGALMFPRQEPMPENDNVVAFTPKVKRSPKIAIDVCDCCGKYLDLVDQYFAQKNGKDKENPDSVTCAECQSNIKLGLPSVDVNHKNLLH